MKTLIIVAMFFLSGCAGNGIPTYPNGIDILSEINETRRAINAISRWDTVPDVSILTAVGLIQRENANARENNRRLEAENRRLAEEYYRLQRLGKR